ncbi:MAG: hypothetical protein ABR543_03785 [Gemmatimonadaceae bacterium]
MLGDSHLLVATNAEEREMLGCLRQLRLERLDSDWLRKPSRSFSVYSEMARTISRCETFSMRFANRPYRFPSRLRANSLL